MNYGALEVLATAPLCYTHLCATEIPLGQSYWGGQIPSFARANVELNVQKLFLLFLLLLLLLFAVGGQN